METPNTETPSTLRVLLADDHAMLRDGIKSLLRKATHIEVVDEAENGKLALERIAQGDIDLLITDISMPEMSGTELTKAVKQDYGDVKVLVLTMYDDREIINEIVMCEAEGYILKNTGKKELLEAIEHIADGGTFYSKEVVNIMMERVKQEGTVQSNGQLEELTPREVEILRLICDEKSTNEIAEELFISPRTVETHRKNILQKTQAKTIVGLIKLAIQSQLI